VRISRNEAMQQAAAFVDETVIKKNPRGYDDSNTSPDQRWSLIERIANFLLQENGSDLNEQYANWKREALEVLNGKAEGYSTSLVVRNREDWMDGFQEAIGHVEGLRLP
jgi:hypothetical protein